MYLDLRRGKVAIPVKTLIMPPSLEDRYDTQDVSAMTTPDSAPLLATQGRLVSALRDAMSIGAGSKCVELIETHISYVLLTGQFAYKIKKAVELGFLDFRTLTARRFYCDEELRLNRRLAPDLYLDIVAITGSVEAPALGGSGAAIEYAVKMREFPQNGLASEVLVRGELSAAHIDTLAAKVAAFHRMACVASVSGPFAVPTNVLRTALQNFAQIRPLLNTHAAVAELAALAAWTEREHAACAAAMAQRRGQGFVRECHGDLHLGNIAFVESKLTIFDCIEFNEEMRWIDVMSEVAFAVMDIRDRGRSDLAHRLLNAYLEIIGDYDGLSVLRFYLVYRAMVRAKISRLRAQQLEAGDAQAAALAEYRSYLNIAGHYAQPPRPAVVITHGLAGSGKTTLSQFLLEMIGAVRIRTDVERKRLHGLPAAARDRTGVEVGLYTPEATRETYLQALQWTRGMTAADFRVIVDATFLKRWQRRLFRDFASELGIPFIIVDFVTEDATLRERVARRLNYAHEASDADLAVLEHQMRRREPLAPDELVDTVVYDAQSPLVEAQLPARWRGVLDRLDGRQSNSVPNSARASASSPAARRPAVYHRPRLRHEPTRGRIVHGAAVARDGIRLDDNPVRRRS
jgi:aminoglycoside phosphotransferase family enzyme/predicted kinase